MSAVVSDLHTLTETQRRAALSDLAGHVETDRRFFHDKPERVTWTDDVLRSVLPGLVAFSVAADPDRMVASFLTFASEQASCGWGEDRRAYDIASSNAAYWLDRLLGVES